MTVLARKAIPFRCHVINSVINVPDMLSEFELLLPWHKATETNDNNRRELCASPGPFLHHVQQARDKQLTLSLDVKDEFPQLEA